jgi:hypothetical protein
VIAIDRKVLSSIDKTISVNKTDESPEKVGGT